MSLQTSFFKLHLVFLIIINYYNLKAHIKFINSETAYTYFDLNAPVISKTLIICIYNSIHTRI